MKNKKLSFFSVAIMYVGTIMGAGFASGREIWQFFGVFLNKAYIGIGLIALLFILFGLMTAYIARKLQTNDMGRIIVPSDNPLLVEIFGYFMAFIMFTVLITMSSAGGSIFAQQFGLSKILGGVVIIALTLITVLGEFQRVSKTFKYIMPVLFVIVITVCTMVTLGNYADGGYVDTPEPSVMASNWFLAAWLYISYNILAMIPIVATSSINAKSEKHALLGTAFGGLMLGVLALFLVGTLLTDPNLSQALDMPMLGFSAKIGKAFNYLYTFVMLFAVFSAATGNYYGFTTKIKEGPRKKWIIIIVAWIGFLCGLVGFKNVIAYMFPAEGFLGFAIMIMLAVNCYKVYKNEKTRDFINFGDSSRFKYPDKYYRVTAGFGGESLLFFLGEYAFLYDTGMAYCHGDLTLNIEQVLKEHNKESLDYILLSHSHYDHMGALPYVLEKYPEAKVLGAPKCEQVFESENAINTMIDLGQKAMKDYGKDVDITNRNFKLDIPLMDGDSIKTSEGNIIAIHTPGHTDCSISYFVERDKLLFSSESTGVLYDKDYISTSILKDYTKTVESAEKLKIIKADYIYIPHYGMLPHELKDKYYDLYIERAQVVREFIMSRKKKGIDEQDIVKEYVQSFYNTKYEIDHPRAAFELNAKYIVANMK